MTALVTAVLAVAARIIARITFAAGSREKPAPAAIAAPAHPAFTSAAVAGSRPAVTRTGVARIAVRPGSRAGSRPLRRGTRHRLAGRALAHRHRTASGPGPGRRRPGPRRFVAGQRRAGECGDERGRGCAAGEQGSLAAGSGPLLVEPVQQPGDRLGVAVLGVRGVDMIEEAGAEDRRIDGLPGERVDACPGEPLPRRSGQRRGADVEADIGDPDLHGRVARGKPGQEVDAPLVQAGPEKMFQGRQQALEPPAS